MLNFLRFQRDKKIINKNLEKDEEGRVVIDITIKDRSEVLSPFVIENKETINNEFANMLDNAVKSVPPKQKLHLKISCQEIEEKDKNIFESAIKNYYLNSSLECERKLKNNMKIFCIMVVLSLLSLGILFLVNFFSVYWLVTEVFDIVVWVFVWEAVDLIAFQRNMIKYERNRNLSLYECFISFTSIDKN